MNLKLLLPLGVLGAAFAGGATLIATSEPVSGKPRVRVAPSVRVIEVEARSVDLHVSSQGTVAPRTESSLIPEVSGPVVWTSPVLVSGGYFEAGDVLLRIDPRDYEAAVARAKNGVIRAEAEYAYARQELDRQQQLAKSDIVSSAGLQDAERGEQFALAATGNARVTLEQAQRDLERTEIRTPFTGRVREERVDVGQFIVRGTAFATLYATDYLEVRLPIADRQLAYFDVPVWQADPGSDELPAVRLHARFAGEERTWVGRIVRTEGEIDAKSRMVHVVARVENTRAENGGPPLTVGLFVQAEIEGRTAERVVVLPRQAVRDGSQVHVVDDESRLRFRQIEILRVQRDEVLVSAGLTSGELVCISQLETPVEGMEVNPVRMSGTPRAAAGAATFGQGT